MAPILHVEQHTALSLTLSTIGALTLATIFYQIVSFLLSTFIVSGHSLEKFKDKKSADGTWAVITGASDGLGRQYALQLADKGFNVLLISRTKSKLDALAEEISNKAKKSYDGGAQAEVLAVDFSTAGDEQYGQIERALKAKVVGVLINNVGLSHDRPVVFSETSLEEMESIIKINCLATLRVTKTVLPCEFPTLTQMLCLTESICPFERLPADTFTSKSCSPNAAA
jgi:17beta-estradiol 17-dehydrogenase / very-long-chain 3-oxoacyl-CoA reductase